MKNSHQFEGLLLFSLSPTTLLFLEERSNGTQVMMREKKEILEKCQTFLITDTLLETPFVLFESIHFKMMDKF
jgi:hypothetical protein